MSDEQESALLAALLEAAADAIIVSDSAGLITRANPAASNLFGYPVQDLIGQNVSILMPDAMAASHGGFMERYLETGEKRIIGIGRDVEGKRRDGSVFPLRLSVGKASVGEAPAFVAILHDLSRQRAAEEAMLRSQRMDAIGQMTGGISHDFNNLLAVVIGNLELLEMTATDDAIKPLIRDALEAAEIGADLTSRLMVVARKTTLKPEPTDLDAVLTTSIRLLQRTLNPQCRIEYVPAHDPWKALIDPTQLHTAILNLALNAQNAMPNGGRILAEVQNIVVDDNFLAQELDVTPGNYVRLTISDTGEGMPDAVRVRALEPFFTTKPIGKGTGLGLSMVYGFVKQSGGHLTIYSEPGDGTKISLYLPALQEDADPAQEAPTQGVSGLGAGRGQRILVVEDDPRVMRVSESRLTALGYTCVCAENADEACRILSERNDIDLVFSDLVMPGKMTGYDLARRIATENPHMRILLTSGFSEGMLRDGKVGAEFPVLGKPYRQDELAKALQALFEDG